MALGIIKPAFLVQTPLLGMKLLNWIFIGLTLVKAYYIAWDFMHLRDEKTGLRRSVVLTAVFLIAYLTTLLLIEGGYVYDTYANGFIKWNF